MSPEPELFEQFYLLILLKFLFFKIRLFYVPGWELDSEGRWWSHIRTGEGDGWEYSPCWRLGFQGDISSEFKGFKIQVLKIVFRTKINISVHKCVLSQWFVDLTLAQNA